MKEILKYCLFALVGMTAKKFFMGEPEVRYSKNTQVRNNMNSNAVYLSQGGEFNYGYNVKGNFVSKSIDDCNIDYGYNVKGDFVPKYIGDKKVEYGYNVKGDFVPKYIDDKKVEYGYNVKGDFVPLYIGGEKIEYGYNVKGDFVIKEIK